jgi:hypothetical protein
MNSNILITFGLILVVALVATTPVDNSEDDSVDQVQVSQSGEEASSEEMNPEGRGKLKFLDVNRKL